MRAHRVAITSLYQYVLRWDIQRNNVPFRGSIQFPTETHCTSKSTTNTNRCSPNLCSLSVTTRTQWSIRIMAIERECESVWKLTMWFIWNCKLDAVSKRHFRGFLRRKTTAKYLNSKERAHFEWVIQTSTTSLVLWVGGLDVLMDIFDIAVWRQIIAVGHGAR